MRGFTYLDDRNWFERNILDGFRAVERPISDNQCRKAARWMKGAFGEAMESACQGTPFSAPLLCRHGVSGNGLFLAEIHRRG